VVDQLTERYANLLRGSYDCVDRVVLGCVNSNWPHPDGLKWPHPRDVLQ
jgi:hypothetical protein